MKVLLRNVPGGKFRAGETAILLPHNGEIRIRRVDGTICTVVESEIMKRLYTDGEKVQLLPFENYPVDFGKMENRDGEWYVCLSGDREGGALLMVGYEVPENQIFPVEIG